MEINKTTKQKICPNCGEHLTPEQDVCPVCGLGYAAYMEVKSNPKAELAKLYELVESYDGWSRREKKRRLDNKGVITTAILYYSAIIFTIIILGSAIFLVPNGGNIVRFLTIWIGVFFSIFLIFGLITMIIFFVDGHNVRGEIIHGQVNKRNTSKIEKRKIISIIKKRIYDLEDVSDLKNTANQKIFEKSSINSSYKIDWKTNFVLETRMSFFPILLLSLLYIYFTIITFFKLKECSGIFISQHQTKLLIMIVTVLAFNTILRIINFFNFIGKKIWWIWFVAIIFSYISFLLLRIMFIKLIQPIEVFSRWYWLYIIISLVSNLIGAYCSLDFDYGSE